MFFLGNQCIAESCWDVSHTWLRNKWVNMCLVTRAVGGRVGQGVPESEGTGQLVSLPPTWGVTYHLQHCTLAH